MNNACVVDEKTNASEEDPKVKAQWEKCHNPKSQVMMTPIYYDPNSQVMMIRHPTSR